MGKKTWTNDEIETLKTMYLCGDKIKDIADAVGHTSSSVTSKAIDLGITRIIVKKNDPEFKAVYQDYKWCYERYINRGMTMRQMADEAKCTLRVMQKWCSEKHRLNESTFKKEKKLNDLQKQVIMFGRLGDGHIDKRENQPMYIESHAENQKDYMFWKWSILKDLCNQEPVYYHSKIRFFNEKGYVTQPSYRLNTRIINDLIPIRNMSKIDIITNLNELGLSLHILDDGYRSPSNWTICVAGLEIEEINLYIKICKEKFNISPYKLKDKRYLQFKADDSRIIDKIILSNIPNDLDIIRYKITTVPTCQPANYIYVNDNGVLIGLNTFCRKHGLIYLKCKKHVDSLQIKTIAAEDLYKLKEKNYETIC